MPLRSALCALVLAMCATTTVALADDGVATPKTQWRRAELYFAIGRWHDRHAARDEKRWHDFLDREVTPRFPEGLSVLDAYGQWLRPGTAKPERLASKVLVILYEDTARHRADLDAIRSAFEQQTGQVSVLRVDAPVEASF